MRKLVEAKHLKKYFTSGAGQVHAVDDVTFSIESGATMGLVGESGCGKSTLGRTLIHLLESTDGNIFFDGKDVTKLNRKGLRVFRNDVQIIFQDPFSSLNPRYTILDTVTEPLILSGRYSKTEVKKRSEELMDLVGLERRFYNSYPHELDGGRRQRAGIARAIALKPKFIVCDEPVSALDVSIQAQILNLLMDLQDEFGLTYLFVTHDLSVVRHISDSISVMYLGQMVEVAPTDKLFKKQLHPYTKALLSAIQTVDIDNPMQRIILKGEITSPINPEPGCRFASRCPYAIAECKNPELALEEIELGHYVACCRARELNK